MRAPHRAALPHPGTPGIVYNAISIHPQSDPNFLCNYLLMRYFYGL
jgi:hypothetical protein